MKLTKISYFQHSESSHYAWKYDSFEVNKINLFVGKNASGKSKTLASINNLKTIFSSTVVPFSNGHYEAIFNDKETEYIYTIEIIFGAVVKEELTIDKDIYLSREFDGIGQIQGEEAKTMIKFKIPANQLAIARRDEIQHPKLEKLFSWAQSLRFFKFAKDQEKESLVIQNGTKPPQDITNNAMAISIFNKGVEEFGERYSDVLIDSMNKLGYEIEKIELGQMKNISIQLPFPSTVSGILIKEKNCLEIINQFTMSDGMFRALAILIHFTYYKLKKISGSILIDDIGEGLDFERSSKLIKMLIKQAESSNIQLLMSTNDKFIMNGIDLEYWQIIIRKGSSVSIKNYENSKEIFDNFKFTGLNNFDFFSTDFITDMEES